MRKGYFTLLLVLAFTVSAQGVVVPNGDFELIRKPGEPEVTGSLIPVDSSWTQGVGANCPIDGEPREYEFSDATTGTLADIPGWVGYDFEGWDALDGTYCESRDCENVNLQGSVANQFNHTDGGTNCYLANGGGWSNPAGGLIESSAPLDIAERTRVYVLSVFAKGITAEEPESPLVLNLLVNGVKRTPDLSADPILTIEWQEYTRTYETLPAGDLTIVVGFGRNAEGAQMHFDDVTFVDAGEAGKRATNPDPSNYAISVPLDKTLGWTAPADVVNPTYDVYLGGPSDPNADTPAPGGSGLSVTSYTPASALEPGQTYSWKIHVNDPANGTYVGYVWKFTTIPSYASDPDPPNGATGVFRNKILSWTVGEKAGDPLLSHTLYMDPNEAKVTSRAGDVAYKVTGLTVAEYDPDPPLEWNSVLPGPLFWRVDEVYASGPIESGVWKFTVAENLMCEDNPTDTDGDCLVNLNDFAAMAANWLQCDHINDDCPE